MSILDQLFPGLAEDPAANPVQVRQLRPEDWIISTTAMAVHQAMNDGFGVPTTNIDTSLGRPNLDVEGTINVATTLKVSLDYRRLLVQDQLKDVRFRPTADDVVDGGIKNGAKVVIKIIPEDKGPLQSWGKIVRHRLEDVDGTPRDLTFDKFSVMSITEPDTIRHQIHETFGADILQTFGRSPRILTISGQVVNGKMDVNVGGEIRSMDWKNAFQRYYERHFSAHACTRKGNKVRIFAQDTVYDGYMLNMVASTTAMDQGISQVTITFLLANRNFPRENDDKIPGFATNNNFVLSGKTTPDELFPQAQIEHYFQNDFSRVVETELFRIDKEVSTELARISALDGISIQKLKNNITLLDLSDNANNFASPAVGFVLHNLMSESQTDSWITSFAAGDTELKNEIETYNLSVGGIPGSPEIAPIPSDHPQFTEFKRLKAEEAGVRFTKIGIAERVTQVNNASLRVEQLERERANLNEISDQLAQKELETLRSLADPCAGLTGEALQVCRNLHDPIPEG